MSILVLIHMAHCCCGLEYKWSMDDFDDSKALKVFEVNVQHVG